MLLKQDEWSKSIDGVFVIGVAFGVGVVDDIDDDDFDFRTRIGCGFMPLAVVVHGDVVVIRGRIVGGIFF